MPTLSSSNRTQLAYKLEGTYPTNFGVPQAGNGTLINFTGESLAFEVKNEMSKAIRSDRQVSDLVQVDGSPNGGINLELNFKDVDPWILGALQSDWVYQGTLGDSAAATGALTLTSTTITNSVAPTGNDAYTVLNKGQWFTLAPPAGAAQAVKDWFLTHPLRVSGTVAPTSTVITLDAATPIATAITTTAMAVGSVLTSARAANATTMKSYTLEVGHLDIGNVFRQYTGMVPSKLDLTISSGAIITCAVDFMGRGFNILTTTSMGTPAAAQTFTPANATKGVWDVLENGTTISTTTYIKSASLSIDNSLRVQDAVGVFGNAGIGIGTFKVTGKLQVYLADSTIYAKVLSGAASSLSLPLLDIDGNGYVIQLGRLKYTAAKVNAGGQDQDNMLDVDFQAVLDNVAASPTFGSTINVYRV
jgi:Phage tail tube protein